MTITTYGGKKIEIPSATGMVDGSGVLSVYLGQILVGQIGSSEWCWWFALPDEDISALNTKTLGS